MSVFNTMLIDLASKLLHLISSIIYREHIMAEMALNLSQILNQPVRSGGDPVSTESLRKSAVEKPTSSPEKAVAEPEADSGSDSSDAKEVSDFKRILKRRLQNPNNADSESPDNPQQSSAVDLQVVTSRDGQAGKSNPISDTPTPTAQASVLNPALQMRGDYLVEQSQAGSSSNSKQDYVHPVHYTMAPAPAQTTKVLDSNIPQTHSNAQILSPSAETIMRKAGNSELQNTLIDEKKGDVSVVNKNNENIVPHIKIAKDAVPTIPTGQPDNQLKISGVVVENQTSDNKTLYNQALQNQAAQNQIEQVPSVSSHPLEANGLKKNTIQNLYKQQSSLIEKADFAGSVSANEGVESGHNKTAMLTKNVAYEIAQPHPAHQIATHNVVNIHSHSETGDVPNAQVTGSQPVQSSSSTLFQKPIEQVLNAIPTTITGSAQQIRVSLSPEELGSVRLTFRQQDEQVEGLIEIQNSEVRKDIEKSIPQIVAALAESGVTVRRIEIIPMQNTPQQQNESFSQGFSAADQQHLAGQANYHAPRGSGLSLGSASVTSPQSAITPSAEKDYDPNALNMYA